MFNYMLNRSRNDGPNLPGLNLPVSEDVIEEYHNLLSGIYDRVYESTSSVDGILKGDMPEAEEKLKKQFLAKHQISQLTQALMEYMILVQMSVERKLPAVSQTSIYTSILRLENATKKKNSSCWELVDHGVGDNSRDSGDQTESIRCSYHLTDFELNLLEQTQSQYVSRLLDEDGQTETLFFPATKKPSPNVVVTWRIIEKIAQVKLIGDETLYMHKLKELTKIRLELEVTKWLNEILKDLKFDRKDDFMLNARSFLKALQTIEEELTRNPEEAFLVVALLDSLSYSYWGLIDQVIEEKLIPLCNDAVMTLDAYQRAYRDFHVNLRDSCILGHALFLRLKHTGQKLTQLAKSSRIDSKGKLVNIEQIFADCFLNLLHVMEGECHQRIQRAVQFEEKDSPIEDECIMSSAVIVLNCFCTVVDEWSKLEIDADDMKMAFLVKITDIICDGAKLFADKMAERAYNLRTRTKDFASIKKISMSDRNRGTSTKDSDYIKKVCYLVNSVVHIQGHVSQLPEIMKWEDLLRVRISDPSVADEKNQIRRILKLLLQSSDSYSSGTVESMTHLLVTRAHHQHSKFLNSWFQIHGIYLPGNQNVEKFLAHLHEYLGTVHEHMKEATFLQFLRRLWISFVDFAEENFQEGKSPEYARTIKKNMMDTRKYFDELEVEATPEETTHFQRVLDLLDMNSKTTVELELLYFSYFADLVTSPEEYLGHVAVQAGYKKTGRGTVDVHFKIKKLQKLPVRKFDISELYVKLQLSPKVIFPSFHAMKTRTLTAVQECPVFDESFLIKNLPVSVLSVEGSVVQAIVSNQDSSFCCEALLKMNRIQDMAGFSSVEFLPVYLLTLRGMDKQHAIFKVLELRKKKKDRQAKSFVRRRKRAMQMGDGTTRNQLLSCVGWNKRSPSLPAWILRRLGSQY